MELTPPEVWSRILERARTLMPEQAYRTWLAQTNPLALTDELLTVGTTNEFAVEWLEQRYGHMLADLGEAVLARRLRIAFRSTAPSASSSADAPTDPGRRSEHSEFPVTAARGGAPAARGQDSAPSGVMEPARNGANASAGAPLNDRYTFERFVVGGSNQLAAAACRAVAEQPACTYNPLFIYGGVGLGKTHLMHAIGHGILARESKRVAYISSERFTNDLIASIQNGRMPDFRRRYREIDLLLIDDVHFLAEKERTQEEFFHTFNALHDSKRQIVLTSDRPPKEIHGLEDRLVTRFVWGLVADIKPPDLETRVAILRKKADEDRIELGDDVLDLIARNCRSNVRELEGAIIKLLAYASLQRREITVELAREALGGVFQAAAAAAALTPDSIRLRVADAWRVSVDALTSKRRTKELTVPRQVAMFLMRELLDLPLVEIGRHFGGRDHSTVIHSVQKVQDDMAADDEFRGRVQRLRTELSE